MKENFSKNERLIINDDKRMINVPIFPKKGNTISFMKSPIIPPDGLVLYNRSCSKYKLDNPEMDVTVIIMKKRLSINL